MFSQSLRTYKQFYVHIKKHFPLLFISTALGFIVTHGLGIAFPQISRYTIDVIIPARATGTFRLLIIGLICLAVVLTFFGVLQSWLGNRIMFSPKSVLSMKVARDCLEVDINRFRKYDMGFMRQLCTGDTSNAIDAAMNIVPSLVTSAISFIIYAIACAFVSVRLTLLALSIVPLHFMMQYFNARYLRAEQQKRQEMEIGMSSFITSTFKAISLVKAFNFHLPTINKYKKINREFVFHLWRIWRIETFLKLAGSIVEHANFLFFSYALYLVVKGELTLGSYSAFIMYVGNMTGPLLAIVGKYNEVVMNAITMDRLLDARLAKEKSGGDSPVYPPRAGNVTISIQSLTFSYGGYDYSRRALDTVSLEIPPGVHMALVGPTGSGKSTLAKVLSRNETRLYDGDIFINDLPHKKIPHKHLRNTFLLCEQETRFLPGTINDNLRLSGLSAKREIHQICKELGVHDVVLETPDQYDTEAFGDFGSTLSGGQMQLLALARCLLRDPPVLILDEITSSMDVESEARAMAVIRQRRQGKTTLFVTHKMQLLRNFDLIAVLCTGRLEGVDSYENLLNVSPTFKSLIEVSANQYLKNYQLVAG
jgi:ABC-type bacteriocin/lantibiotic exporter with double-glycine peptidase domain